MKSAFKEGSNVEIHLLNAKIIVGKVVHALDDFVEILEQKKMRGESIIVCVNYSSVSHIYADVEFTQMTPPGSIPLRPVPKGPLPTN